jgi:hypothetical protein
VLPQAIDSLGAQGWQTESCLCVFILAPMVMFFIEHIIVGDTRGGLSDGQMAHVHIQGGGPKSHQVYVINVSTLKERTTREQPVKFVHGTIEECQECRPMPPQTAPLLPLDERSSLLGSKGRILPRKPSAAESSAALKRCSSGFGVSFRLFAWIVDAALDGVLLATSRELTVLIPLTAAICLCSSGDVVCLYVYFTQVLRMLQGIRHCHGLLRISGRLRLDASSPQGVPRHAQHVALRCLGSIHLRRFLRAYASHSPRAAERPQVLHRLQRRNALRVHL